MRNVMTVLMTAFLAAAAIAATGEETGFTFISPVGGWDVRRLGREERVAAFAKTVVNAKAVRKAEALATSLGCFELYVDGTAVVNEEDGNRSDFLRPGATDPWKRRTYLCYDLTPYWTCAADAANTLSAFVARSWFCDGLGGRQKVKPALALVLRLTYADGTHETITTDETWAASFTTPFLRAGIYWGEQRDGRIALDAAQCAADGKSEINTNFVGVITPREGPGVSLRRDLAMKPVEAYVYDSGKIEGASSNAYGRVVIDRRWDGTAPLPLAPGDCLVVDFGQNCSAIPTIEASGGAGTELAFFGAEMLNDGNGEKERGCDGPGGSVYRANLRVLKDDGARLKYILSGKGAERYEPLFTFMGYRYASIRAKKGPVTIHSVVSTPVTSIRKSMERGAITTGHEGVNRLVENAKWGMYSNYLSIPTDCPQRNERLGWAADTQVFVPSALRFADVYSFLGKWMTDMRDAQDAKGRFAGVAPNLRGCCRDRYGRFGWADAGVIVPWNCWRFSGSTRIIDENWEAMRRFVDFQAETKNKTALAADKNYQNADWLAYESIGGRSRAEYWDFMAACHWLQNARMMRDMARATGRGDEEKRFDAMAASALAYIRAKWMKKNGGRLPQFLRYMQTPQCFALNLGLYDNDANKADAVKCLLGNIAKHDGCLQTGFLGTPVILDALAHGAGRPDAAYSLLLNRKCPGWLYSVDQGATTVWERWNSYTKEKGFGNPGMNSFNHYAYGAYADWLFGTAAGIRPGKNGGFDSDFTLAPLPDERLGFLKATCKTEKGTIESHWEYKDGTCIWRFRVPDGTLAHVVFGDVDKEYTPGAYTLELKKGGLGE